MSHLQESMNSNGLGGYVVLTPLGRGAGSFVFKVQSTRDKSLAALKQIDKPKNKAEKIKARVQNEIEIHSKLNHQNIAKFIKSYEDQDSYYILLEYCSQGELYGYLKSKKRLSENEVRNYGYQLAKGLQYLHSNNVLHRDLKLANILIGEDDVIKICDFGLAIKLTDLNPERDTICGTPNYISPEMINKEPYGIKADCWAYGCILYAMAVGNPPFEGANTNETLQKVAKGKFDIPKFVSKNLADLLRRLISWDQNDRYDMNAVLKHPFFHENLHMNIDLMETPLNASVSFGEGQANDFSHIIKENKNVINSMIQTPTENKKVTKLGQHKVASDARPTTHESRLPPTYRRGSSVTNSVCNSLQNSETKDNNKENHEFQSNYMNIHGNPAKKYASGKPTNGKHSRKGSLEKIDASTPQIAKNKPKELLRIQSKETTEKELMRRDAIHNAHNMSLNEDLLGFNNTLSTNPSSTSRTNLSTLRSLENFPTFATEPDQHQLSAPKLMPLNTHGIKAYTFNTSHGKIEIKEDGWVVLEIAKSKRTIGIAPNGLKIVVKKYQPHKSESVYDLIKLPLKYHKFYSYIGQVCEVIKARAPKVKIEDKEGRFYLTQGKNVPTFEGKFRSGVRVTHTVSSEIMKVELPNGNIFEINIVEDMNELDEYIKDLVSKAFERLNKCLEMNNE